MTRSTVDRQPADGTESRTRHEQTEDGRGEDPAQRDEDQKQADPMERLLHLGERSRDLDRRVGSVREGEDAQVRPVDRDVVPERRATLPRDREDVVADRELDVLARRDENLPVRPHELHVSARLAELGQYRQVGLTALTGDDAQPLHRDLGRPRLERVVDGLAQLLARDQVHHDGCRHDGQRHGGGRPDGDASAEAHVSPRGGRSRRRGPCG